MVPAGNKAKGLSSVNHTTKTIHHHYHHHYHHNFVFLHRSQLSYDDWYNTIHVPLSNILASPKCISEQLSNFHFSSFSGCYRLVMQGQLPYIFCCLLYSHYIWLSMFYMSIYLNLKFPQNFHKMNLITDTTLCSLPSFSYFYTIFLAKAQWMFRHTLSCLLL